MKNLFYALVTLLLIVLGTAQQANSAILCPSTQCTGSGGVYLIYATGNNSSILTVTCVTIKITGGTQVTYSGSDVLVYAANASDPDTVEVVDLGTSISCSNTAVDIELKRNSCATSVFTCNGNIPLPVKLVDQNVELDDYSFKMNWTTASELNNSHFVISKSVDGQNWDSVGSISGAGTTSETQEYTFIGNLELSGEVYFQLKQVDFDGKSETFPIIKKTLSVVLKQPRVFIAENVLNVSLGNETEGLVSVTDLLGRQILSGPILNQGTMDLSGFQPGIYMVTIIGDQQNVLVTQKVFLE